MTNREYEMEAILCARQLEAFAKNSARYGDNEVSEYFNSMAKIWRDRAATFAAQKV